MPELVAHSRQTALHAVLASPVASLYPERLKAFANTKGQSGTDASPPQPWAAQAPALFPVTRLSYGSFAVAPCPKNAQKKVSCSVVNSSIMRFIQSLRRPCCRKQPKWTCRGGTSPLGGSDSGLLILHPDDRQQRGELEVDAA